jgi:ADP-ribosylglycohydrolase
MNTSIPGCLLGGAVGDALGGPIEFYTLLEIRHHFGAKGLTDFVSDRRRKGAITDDTQMTLFTAEGLLLALEKEPAPSQIEYTIAVHQAYLRWLSTQTRTHRLESYEGWLLDDPELFASCAPGNTCISALRSGRMGHIERPINDSKGCGTVMRVAPVGLLLDDPEEAFELGSRVSATTHGHPTGWLAGGALAAIISDLRRHVALREAVDLALDLLHAQKDADEVIRAIRRAVEAAGEGRPTAEKVETLGAGWVAEEALAIGLYAALIHERDFEKGVILAVNHSGDSDSTGSIAGNLLGLINGPEAIPSRWLEQLQLRELIHDMGERLEKAHRATHV